MRRVKQDLSGIPQAELLYRQALERGDWIDQHEPSRAPTACSRLVSDLQSESSAEGGPNQIKRLLSKSLNQRPAVSAQHVLSSDVGNARVAGVRDSGMDERVDILVLQCQVPQALVTTGVAVECWYDHKWRVPH
eukprot:scaffold1768_cov116-Isochrysis_galbana.AAC.4